VGEEPSVASAGTVSVANRTAYAIEVAYLNETWIGDFNAPDPSLWNSAANGTRRDTTVLSTPIEIEASAFKSAVRNGSNTLAIQGSQNSIPVLPIHPGPFKPFSVNPAPAALLAVLGIAQFAYLVPLQATGGLGFDDVDGLAVLAFVDAVDTPWC